MEKKFGILFSEAGKTAKDFLEKSKDVAVKVIDQNNDGQLNMEDVSAIAESVGDVVKKGRTVLKESAGENMRKLELKSLQPIFDTTLEDADFMMTKFIRVADRDKKHAESEVCKGSIGYHSDQKGLRIVNLFKDSVEMFGISFYPDADSEFYYIDPSDRDCYIALDDYFSYLKVARINELQRIAQDLGAKHFRVTFKEEQTAFTEKKIKAGAKIPAIKAEAEQQVTEKKYSTVEIAAEMEFPGHDPIMPTLCYLKKDPSVLNLIDLRMNKQSPVLHHRFLIKLSTSSGIKENDAVKIDAVLKEMKYSGNATVASEAKNESRRFLEYEIDF